MEFLRLSLRRHFAGKPVVVSRNVGYFLSPRYTSLHLENFLAQTSVFLYFKPNNDYFCLFFLFSFWDFFTALVALITLLMNSISAKLSSSSRLFRSEFSVLPFLLPNFLFFFSFFFLGSPPVSTLSLSSH